MRRFLARILKKDKKMMATKVDPEREEFLKVAQSQFRELARKGLSIQVFTL